MMHQVNSESASVYQLKAKGITPAEQATIDKALAILDSQIRHGEAMSTPVITSNYLRLQLAQEKAEVFAVMFLDNRHRVISFDKMFYGTIDGASVYPREVVRRAMEHNAAAVILSHNHPSGITEPSEADKLITNRLKDALSLVEVRVLDHIIVGDDTISFAERGMI